MLHVFFSLRFPAPTLSFPALQGSRISRWAFSCLKTIAVHRKEWEYLLRQSASLGSSCLSSSVPTGLWESLYQLPLPESVSSATQISTLSIPSIFSTATHFFPHEPEPSSSWPVSASNSVAELPAKTNLCCENRNA